MMNQELFYRYKETRDIDIRNELVEKYLYMVDILIRKYLNKGVEYDDLYQVGAMALVSAVERFDPERGYEFPSFATPTILGEIKKHFRDKEWMMKVPRSLKELSFKLTGAMEQLQNSLGRIPTTKEIATFLRTSEEEILQAMESRKAYGTYSIHRTFENAGDDGDAPMFEKYTATEEKGYDRFEISEVISHVLTKLSEKEKVIFRRRFLENMTQGQIAEELGVSQMTVSRAEKGIKDKFLKEYQR